MNELKVSRDGVWLNGNKIERVISVSIKNISPGDDMEAELRVSVARADVKYPPSREEE